MNKKPPSTVYHYTSQLGLMGMVNNKCIWATSAHYQNDSKEFQHALEISNEVIESLSQNKISPEDDRFFRLAKRTLQSIQNVNIFVSSFSEHRDTLSQWRGYCPRGNGYSIGFDSTELATLLAANNFKLVPCIYDVRQQHQVVTELITRILSNYKTDLAKHIDIKVALRNMSSPHSLLQLDGERFSIFLP